MKQNHAIIELTKNDIVRVIHKGSVLHTELASEYIKLIKADLGLDVVALYGTNCTQMMLDEQTPEPKRGLFYKKVSFPKYHLGKRIELTVYIRNKLGVQLKVAPEVRAQMAQIFDDLLTKNNVDLEFPRSLIPQEMELYGFTHQKHTEWDRSKIIQPADEPPKSISVNVEAFDTLAMWHIMSDSILRLGNLDRLKAHYFAKIKCGYDKATGEMNHFVCVHTQNELDEIRSEFANGDLGQRMYEIVKSYDKWEVLPKEDYRPTFMLWTDALARGGFES